MEKKKSVNKKLIIIIAIIAVVVITVVLSCIKIFSNSEKERSYRVIKIHDFSGTMELNRNNKVIKHSKGMNLKKDDEFSVFEKSELMLLADSDKYIQAFENTDFSISSVGYENSGKLKFVLSKGTLLTDIESKLKDDEKFQIETPNAITSVRGTTFSVTYDPEIRMTTVSVEKGVVEVESDIETRSVKAGETVYVIDTGEIVDSITVDSGDDTEDDINPDDDNIPELVEVYEPPALADNPMYWLENDGINSNAHIGVKTPIGWEYVNNDDPLITKDIVRFTNGTLDLMYSLTNAKNFDMVIDLAINNRSKEVKYVTNSDGDEIVLIINTEQVSTDLVTVYDYGYYKKMNDEEYIYISLSSNSDVLALSNVDPEEFLLITTDDFFDQTPAEPEETNPANGALSDGITEEELPDLLVGGANYNQLCFAIKIMQDCELHDNENYVKTALSEIWYTPKRTNVYEPIIASTDSNIYSVSELNELFSLMTDEKINESNIYGMSTLSGEELTYTICNVSQGGTTSISNVSMSVGNGNEILVSYNFSSSVGSDGMSGTKGESVAHLTPTESGLYKITKIERLTSEGYNLGNRDD